MQPSLKSPLFEKPLVCLTQFCCRCPHFVLFIAIAVSAAAVYYTAHHLTMKMSRLDLINPKSGFNQLWLAYIDEFGDSSEAVIVAEGQDQNELKTILDKLSQYIKDKPKYFTSVLSGIDLSALKSKALHYVSVEELRKIKNSITGGAATAVTQDNDTGQFTLPQSEFNAHYFIFPAKGSYLGFILLKLNGIDKTQFSQGTESIASLRELLSGVRTQHPAVNIGLTGMPILENDEMVLSNEAMMKATLLALAGVTVVFVAGFGSLRFPFYAMLALVAAFAWTLGYITLAVGHLNILSIAFGAMLIGLGTDFSVHYLARFLDLRRTGFGVEEALCKTAEVVGPGILTGALTTSAAFYAASFAEFTGIAELGTIAGGGILFCCLMTFTVFPALIMVSCPAETKTLPLTNYRELYNVKPLLAPFFWFPRLSLLVFVIGFSALCCGIPKVWYDYNLLHLQPAGLESVEWEQKLLEQEVDKGGKTSWFALSIADTKDELLWRKKRFAEKYPELMVEEIVSLLPEESKEKTQLITDIRQALESVLSAATMLPPALTQMQNNLYAMSNPVSPTIEDLPKPLVERFVGKRGKHLMRIYTTANIWDMDALEQFVHKVRDIDPKATGSPLQTYESSLQMRQGFVLAAGYAFIAILVLLLLDFQSLGASLAAIFPTVLGFAMMFGIIGWLDLPLNPANMIVLPLILGIGLDDGVYLVHEYRQQKADKERSGISSNGFELSISTASAIVITTLTTMIGFGSMMIASHRGLQSLGRVLVIGVVCCLLTSLVVLPLLMKLAGSNGGTQTELPVCIPHPPLPDDSGIKQKRLVKREEFG